MILFASSTLLKNVQSINGKYLPVYCYCNLYLDELNEYGPTRGPVPSEFKHLAFVQTCHSYWRSIDVQVQITYVLVNR